MSDKETRPPPETIIDTIILGKYLKTQVNNMGTHFWNKLGELKFQKKFFENMYHIVRHFVKCTQNFWKAVKNYWRNCFFFHH